MKEALVLGTGITAFPTVFVRKCRAAWEPGTVVHPGVDNLRVVGITDPAMARTHEPVTSWNRQEEIVVPEAVAANMDKIACALAETRNPDEAWRSIFLKPPRKSWSDAVVAVKTNNIGRQHTRSAVMAKLCHTLTGILGVRPQNLSLIHI